MGLTRRHHPFFWSTQPSISFTAGTSATYNLAQHVSNPLALAVSYSVQTGTLPNGVTLNAQTGLLTYTGATGVTASVKFAVANADFTSHTSPSTVTINLAPVGNQPPVWSVAPTVNFTIGTGATYNLAQHVSDPNSDPLTFSALAPFPSGVTMSSAGLLTWTGTGTAGTTVVPVDAAEAGVSTDFTDIPEIVFVAGFAQVAQLGIFHVDQTNRWTPGDLTRTLPSHRTGAPWTAAATTTLVDATTLATVSDPFVSYSSTTAQLSYTGVDPGTTVRDLTVRLRAQVSGGLSPPFRIRVLRAKTVFGTGAATKPQFSYLAAGQKFDPATGATFTQARQATSASSDTTPGVLVVLAGTYTGQDYFCGAKRFFYLLGEPGNRPVLQGDNISFSQSEIFYVKGLELINCEIIESGWRTDTGSALYVTECYQHDGAKAISGIVNPNGVVPINLPRKVWVWTFEGKQMGDPGNADHQMYIEGRPNMTLYVNNIHVNGTRGSSCVKTTAQTAYLWNSDLSAVQDEANPSVNVGTTASTILFDVPAVSNSLAYNNRFACFSSSGGGLQAGTVFWRARKPGMNASDIPAYPDLDYDAGTTTQTTMSAPPGFPAGPETYKNSAYWAALNAKAPTDETNAYTYKHFLAFNQFVLLPGSNQTRVLRDDGTHPVEERSGLGGTNAIILPTHPSFSERSVTFLANNRYTGWTGTPQCDMTDYEAVFAVEDDSVDGTPKWRTDLSDPGNGRQIPANFKQVNGTPNVLANGVGGELIGTGTFTPITLPSWFTVARFGAQTPSQTVLQAAIEAITAPHTFGAEIDCPSLGESTARLDPENPDGQDYPDAAGGTTTYGWNMTRAWIWGSRFCWDPVRNRAFGICSPHGFDEFGTPNGYHNGFITLCGMYDEATNEYVAFENPLSTTGVFPSPITVGHLFDTQCIAGRRLYKWTTPIFTTTYVQPQLIELDLDGFTTDVTSGRSGVRFLANLGRPPDPSNPPTFLANDVTAPALDYLPGLNAIVMLHKSRLYFLRLGPRTWDAAPVELGFSVSNAFHNVGHYHPNTGYFVGGGGSYVGTNSMNFQFVAVNGNTGAITVIDNCPVVASVNETNISGTECKAVFVPDPASTESILFHDNGNIYGCDFISRPVGSHWRTIGTIPAEVGEVDWACAIWNRGAILTAKSGVSGTAKLRPYRGA